MKRSLSFLLALAFAALGALEVVAPRRPDLAYGRVQDGGYLDQRRPGYDEDCGCVPVTTVFITYYTTLCATTRTVTGWNTTSVETITTTSIATDTIQVTFYFTISETVSQTVTSATSYTVFHTTLSTCTVTDTTTLRGWTVTTTYITTSNVIVMTETTDFVTATLPPLIVTDSVTDKTTMTSTCTDTMTTTEGSSTVTFTTTYVTTIVITDYTTVGATVSIPNTTLRDSAGLYDLVTSEITKTDTFTEGGRTFTSPRTIPQSYTTWAPKEVIISITGPPTTETIQETKWSTVTTPCEETTVMSVNGQLTTIVHTTPTANALYGGGVGGAEYRTGVVSSVFSTSTNHVTQTKPHMTDTVDVTVTQTDEVTHDVTETITSNGEIATIKLAYTDTDDQTSFFTVANITVGYDSTTTITTSTSTTSCATGSGNQWDGAVGFVAAASASSTFNGTNTTTGSRFTPPTVAVGTALNAGLSQARYRPPLPAVAFFVGLFGFAAALV